MPEYETVSMFGPICQNDDLESIIRPTTSATGRAGHHLGGRTIAFAIECYENGLITQEDTGGIELTWGNHRAMVAMTGMPWEAGRLRRRLADGVKAAAERIGRGADNSPSTSTARSPLRTIPSSSMALHPATA